MPSSLQPLNDGGEAKRAAQKKIREEDSMKWERLRQEVGERKQKEDEERRKFVDITTQKKVLPYTVLPSKCVQNSTFFLQSLHGV